MSAISKLLTLIILPSIIISCDPCLMPGYSCADPFYFRIVNKASGEDLVFSQRPVYHKDSVYLLTTLPGYLGPMSTSDSNKFQSTLLIPVDTFYLHLSSTDTDTLLMNYDFVKDKCCKTGRGFGKIREIKYNGLTAKMLGDVFIFEK